MDSIVLLIFRIGLLVLLWFFVFMAILAMRRDTKAVAGPAATRGRRRQGPSAPLRREKAGQITVVEGPLTGSHMDISSVNDVVLGRSPDSDFQLGDDYASSSHARLFRRGSEWFIEDLDSRNGTFVSGARIDQPERVSVGTDIKMGGTVVRLIP